jgi:NOL1/NOP2/sun family putative RNA methylase
MKSIRQATSRLPHDFVDRLYQIYGTHQAERIMRGLSADRLTTLRVNTTRTNIHAVMADFLRLGIKVERVGWNPTALVVKNKREKDVEATSVYRDGSIYLQSLSSQLPPLVLNPQPGERVADIAAAPGGKTTQLAALMRNEGYVLATEINAIRGERLKYNVAMQGASIVEVRIEDGRGVGHKEPESYDRVLLDAPCTGEGLFVPDQPHTYRHWSLREVRHLASEQRRLMVSAVEALKPGGTLVYSTCTMSPEENEGIVTWALSRFADALRVETITLEVPGVLPGLGAFADVTYAPALRAAIRIPPSELMEGFFTCKLKKVKSCFGALP